MKNAPTQLRFQTLLVGAFLHFEVDQLNSAVLSSID